MNVEELLVKPHLQEMFNHLRGGRHLSIHDGPVYLAVRADYGQYRMLFGALGFDLVEHDRGFYYFQSGEDLGKEATQLVVFFFVLVEAWGDAGHDLEAVAFDPGGHAVAELPHFSRESWRACMSEAGVPNEAELANVVKKLDRYGFAERLSDDRFRFLSPAWRFFDVCREVWTETESSADVTAAEDDA
ncbi:MAG: hypothetical protein H6716_23655 [Polyangiaceae bacterium]|nr:hypothetical protein [Polyangiaceae bacterium]